MYIPGPEFLSYLVVAVSRFRAAKFFGWKSSRENFEYMNRIIFLCGNYNRRQDIFKSCRRAPGPGENANIYQKYISCDHVSRMKTFARKFRIYDWILCLGGNSNRWANLFRSCRGGPRPLEQRNITWNYIFYDEICMTWNCKIW